MSAPAADPVEQSAAQSAEPPLDALVLQYLDWLAGSRKLAEHTLQGYRRDLLALQTHAARLAPGTALTALRTDQVRSITARLRAGGLAASSIARALSAWRGFYLWAARHGHGVEANPVDGIRAPRRGRPLPKALSVEHAVALVDHVSGPDAEAVRDRAAYELCYSSGLRVSELVQLDLRYVEEAGYRSAGWIDLAGREVTVLGKGSRRRTVPVGAKAAEALREWLALREPLVRPAAGPEHAHALFLTARGLRLSDRTVRARLKQQAIRAGVPADVHPHMLRHSFASHVLQSSGDLRAVQEMLGHASVSTTQIYTSLDFQHLASVYDKAHPRAKARSADEGSAADPADTTARTKTPEPGDAE
ncbi:tyrosine recombinase XerC [Paracidovorax citrulli]